ncbi:UDP-glucuronic acid decarboxylase family protein [Candidatus Ruminimicrobiellum ovillum]|uniref:UDP-glucuronic acid decarboxylase family protein n=1 Tax=Candidatus Ruminimicrobiellum ovillum TaxID=1947927 RepID=UPI003559F21F
MNILLAGGAGFLGSHFCDFLLEKGHSVYCIDNFITGKKENIKHLLNNKKFKFKKIDITKKFSIKEKFDCVINFASIASPVFYYKYKIETLLVGSYGTYNLLELARKNKAKFLMASTSEVYGDPACNPQKETYWGNVNPIGKRSMYDESKRFSEALIMNYHRVYDLDTKMVRIFNTYGPRMNMNDGRVVPQFINQALNNKPITVFGKGTQTRSLCYVSDLIAGIYKLLISKEHTPVNIGNPHELAVKEIAKTIIKLTNSKSKIIYKPLPEDDPKKRRPDISKAKKILKWEPKVDLNQGLLKTIDYFKRSKI